MGSGLVIMGLGLAGFLPLPSVGVVSAFWIRHPQLFGAVPGSGCPHPCLVAAALTIVREMSPR
jgi:hypothetical protein